MIAQEVEKVYPHLVTKFDASDRVTDAEGKTEEINNVLGLNYNGLIVPLVKAVQDFYTEWFRDSGKLHEQIDDLKSEVNGLHQDADKLREEVRALKQMICLDHPQSHGCNVP